jgi:hypothetical protein
MALMIDEVKKIHDKAAAMAMYAKQSKDKKLIAYATDIRKRAERRLGEVMEARRKAGQMAKGTRGQLAGKRSGTQLTPQCLRYLRYANH